MREDATKIAALERKVEDLEAELAYWHDLARPPPYAFVQQTKAGLSLGLQHICIARLLIERGAVGKELIMACLGEGVHENYHRVALYQLRRALRPHGITIRNLRGWGYDMRPADRERLRRLMGME